MGDVMRWKREAGGWGPALDAGISMTRDERGMSGGGGIK